MSIWPRKFHYSAMPLNLNSFELFTLGDSTASLEPSILGKLFVIKLMDQQGSDV